MFGYISAMHDFIAALDENNFSASICWGAVAQLDPVQGFILRPDKINFISLGGSEPAPIGPQHLSLVASASRLLHQKILVIAKTKAVEFLKENQLQPCDDFEYNFFEDDTACMLGVTDDKNNLFLTCWFKPHHPTK